jgi:hypothetical protein
MAMAADLQIISGALEAYRNDFGDYPRIPMNPTGAIPTPTGAALLCWALVAPGPAVASPNGVILGDGADGPGFRVRGTTGTVKGPYLPADRFTIGVVGAMDPTIMASEPARAVTTVAFDNMIDVIADRYYHPILYFAANKAADPSSNSATTPFVSELASSQSTFNYGDCVGTRSPADGRGLGIATAPQKLTLKVMRFRLGDSDADGRIDPTRETAVTAGPYLLWAAGPDGVFGSEDDVADNGSAVQLNTPSLPPNIYP